MKEVLDFLDEAKVYFLATSAKDVPYVRPFGTANIFEDKLYIQTGKLKKCFQEIMDNPIVEISAFNNGKWIRIKGKLNLDDRVEAKKSMLDKYPELRGMYNEEDRNTAVLYFSDATATIYSFTEPSVTIKF